MTRKELEKKFLRGVIPFALDESIYKRFSERDTIFARVMWDESFVAYRRGVSERESNRVNQKGYSRPGFAARAASWTVYDNFEGAFAWDRIRPEGNASLTEVTSKLSKYESSNLEENAKLVKRVGQIFGACDVGICRVDPQQKFVYTHNRRGNPVQLPEGAQYAIVMLIQMDFDGIATSQYVPAAIATGNGYSRMAFTNACMGEFLRNLGYTAVQAGNDTGLSVPLAIQAGLGQLGRHGILIHPKYGPCVRICKTFTDFPMATDEPIDFGVIEFCRVCKKCATDCPSKSIPMGDPSWESPWNTVSNNDGVFKWYVNGDECYHFWVRNGCDCSNCIRVCPFTKPQGFSHDIARFFIKHFRFMDRFWVLIDDMMGKLPPWRYGKRKNPEKFWKSDQFLDK